VNIGFMALRLREMSSENRIEVSVGDIML